VANALVEIEVLALQQMTGLAAVNRDAVGSLLV
jgi:hypothetical protein